MDDENPEEDCTMKYLISMINIRINVVVVNAKKTNMSHLLNFHYLDKQRVNVRGNRRSFNYYSNNRWSSSAGIHLIDNHFPKNNFFKQSKFEKKF